MRRIVMRCCRIVGELWRRAVAPAGPLAVASSASRGADAPSPIRRNGGERVSRKRDAQRAGEGRQAAQSRIKRVRRSRWC